MKKLLFRSFVELSNHRIQSVLLKAFATSKISKPLIPLFVNTFKLNEEEMGRSIREYGSLHELFIRQLKPGCRPIESDTNSFISPVDGVLADFGKIKDNVRFSVKGQEYSVSEMLGSKSAAKTYEEGLFLILYLSPSHYHRIHSPISGEVLKQWTLGGRSYPVNELGMTLGRRPLSRNYRVITEMLSRGKKLAVVKVGAMNVNTIELTHQTKSLNKGEEIGYFSFGSTVVLLIEKGLVSLDEQKTPREFKMGEKLGTFIQ
ncbi:phosphatidylserine decarboxylase [Halalkalibacter urbisdiaboli]|uniref:phosphatidylserine decarboxylase n=1 Tax=Halalkalibacter urbisdiaboli TaxID=1960589 RepID=UPI000B440211|nr:phosphatidylserine decarboxylase [Halalkalibacter urbisdiaboli]